MSNKTKHFNYYKSPQGGYLVLDNRNRILRWKERSEGRNRAQRRADERAWKKFIASRNQETASMEAIRKAKAKKARRKANKVAYFTRKRQ